MKEVVVVCIAGKAEAGKSLSANILKDFLTHCGYDATIVPYAAHVKDTAKLLFGWDGKKDETGRALLQQWGTNIVRAKEPLFWVETVARLVRLLPGIFDFIIIDDCRFPNEIEAWSGTPHIAIRVERPGHENSLTEEQRNHPSETALDNWEYDFTISATDKEMLSLRLKTIVLPRLLRLIKGDNNV